MKYTVLWTASAEQELAAIWTAATDRVAVTSASNQIDRVLASDPERQGEACFDTVRTLVIEPPGVDFEVMAADRTVYVLSVWHRTGIP